MALYLSEQDVDSLLTPEDALDAVEGSFRRMAEGQVENVPRRRLRLDGGALAVMSAVDLGLGVAGVKTYAAGRGGVSFVVILFDASSDELIAVIEADRLGQFRTGAATAWRRSTLRRRARRRSVSSAPDCRRRCSFALYVRRLPAIDARAGLLAHAGAARGVRRSARRGGGRGEPGGGRAGRRRHDHDVARPGAARATGSARARSSAPRGRIARRRASSTTPCSSGPRSCAATRVEDARIESGDLIEPVAQGVLDWLEVHELSEVVSGQVQGRQSDDDIVVFKSNGIAAWDVAIGALAVERARERGIGREL